MPHSTKTHMRAPQIDIKQPIIHAGPHSRDAMNYMIETDYLKNEYTKPDNITFITAHNYVDDELMWSAFLASLPSFIIFGIAIEGLMYRLKQIESDDISDINP